MNDLAKDVERRMAGEVFNRITDLMRQQKIADAIALCRATLDADEDPNERPRIVTALCLCLAGLGRLDEAAAAYERHRDDFHVAAGIPYTTAALAARHGPDIQDLFRAKSALYMDQPIGFSALTTCAAWSANSGIGPITIDPRQEVTPVTPGRAPYTVDPYLCYQIPSGEFVSGWDFAFAPGGHFLADSGYMALDQFYGVFPYEIETSLNLIAHVWPSEVEEIDNDVLFMSCPRGFHVGHFIVDFLPRLRSLSIFGPHVKIALPREAPQKFVDLLACFGIGASRLIRCDLGKRYRFRTLIVAQVGRLERPNPRNMHFLRAAFAPKEPEVSEVRGYFFSRGIGTRQIVNQQEVDQVLGEFKITRIDLEAISIAEQRAAMAKAQLLIGTYGSDLLASLFAPSGAHAIELIWGHEDNTVEWCLRSGIHHEYLVCETAQESGRQLMKKDRDLIVDCDVLRQRVAAIIAATSRLRG